MSNPTTTTITKAQALKIIGDEKNLRTVRASLNGAPVPNANDVTLGHTKLGNSVRYNLTGTADDVKTVMATL